MPGETKIVEQADIDAADEAKRVERGDYLLDADGKPIKDGDGKAKVADEGEGGEGGEEDGKKKPDADAGADDDDDKNHPVNRQRFNRVNDKLARTLEANAKLEGQLEEARKAAAPPAKTEEAKPVVVDVKALRRQAKEAMLEGDVDKASDLDEKADAEIQRRAEESANARAAKAKEEAMAELRAESETEVWTATVDAAIAKYPMLNSSDTNTKKNQEAIDDVSGWTKAYIANGMPRSAALAKALDKIMPAYVGDTAGGGNETAEQRRMKSLQRASAASRAQPAPLSAGQGSRTTSSTRDVSEMTEDEFRALPESEKAKLRGDFIEAQK